MEPTKASRGENKYERILRAAVKVFARKGFHSSRISEVAREAGVADGTIYLYFRSKDDILIQLFELSMDRLIAQMKQEVAQEDDPLARIRRFAQVQLAYKQQDPDLAEVMGVEIRQSSRFMREYVNRRFREYIGILTDIIEEGQRRGLIRPELNPRVISRSFWGALDEVARYWVLSAAKPFDLQEAGRQLSEVFIRGMQNPGLQQQGR